MGRLGSPRPSHVGASMNSGVPWNISDVRPQARETALEAARRCNMSVGDWLSNVIVAQAARQGATRSPAELQARDAEERELADTMERIARHLEQSAPPSPDAIPEPSPPPSPIAPRAPQPRGPEAYAPRKAMQSPPPAAAPAPKPDWSPALDQAMAEIAARQRALDGDASSPQQTPSPAARAEDSRPPSPALSGLEKQLRQLTAQIESLHRPKNSIESAIKALRNDLAEIGRAITQAMPRQAIETLESEIRKLAERVEQNRQSIDRSSIAGMERRLGEMLASLQALTPAERLAGVDEALSGLGRKLDQIVASKQDAGALPQFEAAIAGLRAIVSHVASGEALSKLRGEMRALSSQIKPPSEPAPAQNSFASMHETIDHVVDHLAAIEQDLRAASGAAPGARMPATPAPAIAPSMPAPPLKPAAAWAQKPQPVDPNLAADHPLEPGSGIPARRVVAPPAERIATAEPAAGAAKSAPKTGLTDFIAAARRAAQAATPSLSPNKSTAEGKETPEGGKSLAQRMRSLLPGASVLLLALGSFYAVVNPYTPLPKPGVSEAPTEQSQPATPALAGLVHTIESVSAAPPQLTRLAPDERRSPLPTPASRADGTEVTGSLPTLPEGPSSSHALVPALPLPQQAPQLSDKLPPSLHKAAAVGNPAAEYEVALRHLEGRGVPQSSEEAARWLDRAARSGLVPAQFRLGSLYEKGHGVKKNRDAARALYLTAAENGNAKAMHNLAVLYAEGIAGKPDYQAAALWFRKAASHGIADSQYNLGILYARGAGVEQNLAESYKWFSLAAAQGDKESTNKREDIGARLDPQALMAAQLAVQTFVVEPQPEEATNVRVPEGGWDRPSVGTSPAAPAKKRLANPRP